MKKFRTKIHLFQILVFILIGVIIVGGVLAFGYTSFNDHTYTVTVTDKERVYQKDSSKYLIFTKDKDNNERVFEDTDNVLRFKFNSSDLFGELKQNKTYNIKVVGYRIPILSWYENIISIEESK